MALTIDQVSEIENQLLDLQVDIRNPNWINEADLQVAALEALGREITPEEMEEFRSGLVDQRMAEFRLDAGRFAANVSSFRAWRNEPVGGYAGLLQEMSEESEAPLQALPDDYQIALVESLIERINQGETEAVYIIFDALGKFGKSGGSTGILTSDSAIAKANEGLSGIDFPGLGITDINLLLKINPPNLKETIFTLLRSDNFGEVYLQIESAMGTRFGLGNLWEESTEILRARARAGDQKVIEWAQNLGHQLIAEAKHAVNWDGRKGWIALQVLKEAAEGGNELALRALVNLAQLELSSGVEEIDESEDGVIYRTAKTFLQQEDLLKKLLEDNSTRRTAIMVLVHETLLSTLPAYNVDAAGILVEMVQEGPWFVEVYEVVSSLTEDFSTFSSLEEDILDVLIERESAGDQAVINWAVEEIRQGDSFVLKILLVQASAKNEAVFAVLKELYRTTEESLRMEWKELLIAHAARNPELRSKLEQDPLFDVLKDGIAEKMARIARIASRSTEASIGTLRVTLAAEVDAVLGSIEVNSASDTRNTDITPDMKDMLREAGLSEFADWIDHEGIDTLDQLKDARGDETLRQAVEAIRDQHDLTTAEEVMIIGLLLENRESGEVDPTEIITRALSGVEKFERPRTETGREETSREHDAEGRERLARDIALRMAKK